MQATSNSRAETRNGSSGPDLLIAAGLCALSTVSWLLVCAVEHRREAWDTGTWFVLVVPLLLAVSTLTGWWRPSRAWRWPLALAGGQGLGLALSSGGSLSLWPLTLFAIAMLFAPCFVAAKLGARLARR